MKVNKFMMCLSVLTVLAWFGADLAVAQPTVNVTITYVSTGKTYQVANANPGEYLYTDRARTYGYRFLPDRTTPAPDPTVALETTAPLLFGQKFIRVSNDDKNQTVARYLEFTIDKPCTIYIAYDKRGLPASLGGTGGNPADWLEDGTWTLTDMTVCWYVDNATPSQDGSSPMPVFAKDFEAGTVTLGGPRFGTYQTVDTNFIPFIVPKDPTYNPPPVVNAGQDKTGHINEVVQLTGASITDQDPEEGEPGVVSFYWAVESGPEGGNAVFSATDILEPTVTFDTKGLYELLLQATDGAKDANDIVTIDVRDRADEFLVGRWDMEMNVEDQSSNSNDGTLAGTAAYDADSAIGDYSMNLLTTDVNTPPYIYLGPAPELDFAYPGDFTVAAWVKTTSAEQSNVFTKGGDEDGGIRYMLSVGESDNPRGRTELILDDNVNKYVATGTSLVNDGLWHFVVGVRERNASHVYVDGRLEASATLGVNYDLSGTSQTGAYIGVGIISPSDADRTDPNDPFDVFKAGAPQKDFNGLVDEVRVYNYALPLVDLSGYDSVSTLAMMGPLTPKVTVDPVVSPVQYKFGDQIPLNATLEDLGAPSTYTILWTTQAAPSEGVEAIFTPSDQLSTNVKFTEFGAYTLRLTVIDAEANATVVNDVQIELLSPTCQDVIDAGLLFAADMDQDCDVDLADLALMLVNWTACNDPADPDCTWPF
ncbi:MAG: LamG domain-containing protein [Sedimentisphaerales bacterium]|nr:LamG domain-containing protein [Sedimentisphaerales bacterium]